MGILDFILKPTKGPYLKNGVRGGCAQLIGRRQYQNDAVSIQVFKDKLLAVLANGAGDKPVGNYASVTVTKSIEHHFLKETATAYTQRFFEQSFVQAERKLSKLGIENRVSAAALAVIIMGNQVHWGAKGDCRLYLFRGGELFWLNGKWRAPLSDFGQIAVVKSDALILCSVGFYTALTEMDILYQMKKAKHPKEACSALRALIEKRRYLEQDNASVIILDNIGFK